MSEQPEPTLRDVIAAINGLAEHTDNAVQTLAGRIDAVDARVDYSHRAVMAKLDSVKADVSALSAEVLGLSQTVTALKTDAALTHSRAIDAQEAVRRHLQDPNAHGQAAA